MARIKILVSAALVAAMPMIAYPDNHTIVGSSEVDEAAIEKVAKEVPSKVRKKILSNPQAYLKSAMQMLYQVAPDGVATPEKIEILDQIKIARQRAQILSRGLVIDVDGDGTLTASEFEIIIALETPSKKSQFALLMINADADEDGSITFDELLAYANRETEKNAARRNNRQNFDILALDVNGDGQVNASEIAKMIDAVVKLGATGGTSGQTTRTGSRTAAVCTAPVPPMGVDVILLGGKQGSAISTVAVSDLDRETSVATLTIEDGDTPLFIIATAYESIVWRFKGATQRIWKFVAQPAQTSSVSGVGVTGLTKDQVAFVSPDSCFKKFYTTNAGKAARAKIDIASHIGRIVDYVVASNTLANIQLPSGIVTSNAESGGLRQKWEPQVIKVGGMSFRFSSKGLQLLDGTQDIKTTAARSAEPRSQAYQWTLRSLSRFYPDGIIQVDASDVISSDAVQEYTVLPQQAGLLQLIATGSLRIMPNRTYLIEQTFDRFPAGLNGAYSVKFALAKGVSMPKGSPGQSTVTQAETGECIKGPLCNN